MARGKNIQLFLMDGTPKGRIKCTLANWTGLAYKIPRTELDRAKDIDFLNQSGIYFLFGKSDEDNQGIIYVGQAGLRKNGNGILNRLFEHRRNLDKDYWTEALVLTTSNDTFGPTEISYLENQFTKLARDNNRYLVKNGIEPSLGHVTEEKESELEEYIDYAKIITGVLGYRVFEPLIESDFQEIKTEAIDDGPLLKLKFKPRNEKQIEACGKQTSEGFVVLKGSKLRAKTAPSMVKGALLMRKKVKINNQKFILLEDVLFTSPSTAASFITGSSVNGRDVWKDEQDRSINDLEQDQ
ncbi:GIY-YIG nuclease family protein [Streptococcaceae bacterium ESL0729]|nr:GIY-YIG nuclease family protein [Streptococcaceae bacterium ESL0729]